MTIRINLWTIFWLFVFPVFPLIGGFVADSNYKKGKWTRKGTETVGNWAVFLTLIYFVLFMITIIPSVQATTILYADPVEQRVTVEEGVTALVTVEYTTFIQLPWSYCEQKKYVRFEPVGESEEEVWWIDIEDSTKIDESGAKELNKHWKTYWASIQKEADSHEAKVILQQRYQQQD